MSSAAESRKAIGGLSVRSQLLHCYLFMIRVPLRLVHSSMVIHKQNVQSFVLAHGFILGVILGGGQWTSFTQAQSLRIKCVVPIGNQPHARNPATIWYDDFETDAQWNAYAEKSGSLDESAGLGETGRSLRMDYAKGERGTGGAKLFFGDSPAYRAKVVRKSERFDDVYWRVYVMHQAGWTGGGPAKLSRATSMASSHWSQAMIAHVWSSGESLTLDPATGVKDGNVITRRYNDFDRLDWLGNKPVSKTKIHSKDESGWWVCVESRAKLNTPGKSDGLNQLWIDGNLECERRNLDWRGDYDQYGINAVFLEAYWNDGSPIDQSRWSDNFVISTERIGSAICSCNPMLIRTSLLEGTSWQAEVATAGDTTNVVWRSNSVPVSDRVAVNERSGEFVGRRSSFNALSAGEEYVVRIRLGGPDGIQPWSRWHQRFRTGGVR
ncbi:hypothetical protein CA13_02420 [Planctomycetes bacterium CA13]|uniref:Uncharacterized protein n=1 Tax=Novipirellula herctigrandis TaxID=2527986 RepID=A0A5C5YV40_9BACT|nr:hypothetical protein CA13_02420 [Planctomycetes bacterium CA13]